VWKVQKAVDDNLNGAFIFLDLSNAFNTMDRRHLASALATYNPHLLRAARWAYGSPSPLLMRSEAGQVETLLLSSQGVRQGDPLGPLFFSYGFRERLDRLAGTFADDKADFSAYLDDTVVWVPHNDQSPLPMREQAQAALNSIVEDFRDHDEDGLSLNVAKCHVHTVAEIRVAGVQLLGTCVGTEAYRRVFLTAQIEAMLGKIAKVLRLPRQAAYLLLRACVAPTLLHLLRCLDSDHLDEQWTRATAALQESARTLSAVPFLDEAARVLTTLPIRLGGLGFPDYGFIQPHARVASQELAQEFSNFLEVFQYPPTRDDLLATRSPPTLQPAQEARAEAVLEALEGHRRIAMVENASKLGSAWARMIPIYPTRVLSDRQVASALGNRLLISSETADQCSSCHQRALFQHGDVCEVRRRAPGQVRHNAFRDLLARQAKAAGSTAVTECAANAPEANNLLRGDILVTGVAAPDGMAGVVDISFTAPSSLRNITRSARIVRLPQESVTSWTKRQLRRMTALREDDKRRKYAGAFLLPFTPVALTAGGFQGSFCKEWLKRLGVYAQGKLASAFDLSVALVRARAATLQ
jgi:reverse transcriptase-like protein